MSTENYCENQKLQRPYFEDNTLSNRADGKLAEEAGNNKSAKAFFRWNPLVANDKYLRRTGFEIRSARTKAILKIQKFNIKN